METRTEVKVLRIQQTCEKCGTGEMVAVMNVSHNKKREYLHVCLNCREEQTFDKIYPYNEYVPIPN